MCGAMNTKSASHTPAYKFGNGTLPEKRTE